MGSADTSAGGAASVDGGSFLPEYNLFARRVLSNYFGRYNRSEGELINPALVICMLRTTRVELEKEKRKIITPQARRSLVYRIVKLIGPFTTVFL